MADINEYNVDFQFSFFLKTMGLDETKLPRVQHSEMKKAFAGGMSQMYLLMNDCLKEGESGFEKLVTINNQLKEFWATQAAEFQKHHN